MRSGGFTFTIVIAPARSISAMSGTWRLGCPATTASTRNFHGRREKVIQYASGSPKPSRTRVVDTASRKVIKSVPVGRVPYAVAIDD